MTMQPGDTIALVLPPISRATLALYAGASGDHNPVHIDLDECRAVGIDDVFAHGMLSMAYLGRLLTDHVPQERIRSLDARFVAITPVRATPTCRGTVRDVRDGLVHLDLEMTIDDGTRTVVGAAVVEVADADADGGQES